MNKHARRDERGNVFVVILLAIALFAALSFTVSRSMQTDTSTNLMGQELQLAAGDILTYVQKLERGMNRLRNRGISENDISLIHPSTGTLYEHGTPRPDNHKLFHPSGGGVVWQEPQTGVNDGSPWFFTGSTCIPNLGFGAAGCDSDSTSNEELLAVLRNLDQDVCTRLNSELGIAGIPTDSGGGFSTTAFVGTFSDGTEITLSATYRQVCFEDSGAYHFYSAILER